MINNLEDNTQYNEDEIKCKNYIICNSTIPEWDKDICINCDLLYGKWKGGKGILPIYENKECPICLDIETNIELPYCNHTLCLNCFNRCFHVQHNIENMPIFPYPDLEEEYYNNPEHIKWDIDYPLIKSYYNQLDIWEKNNELQYENESHLHKCPICRK